MNNRKPSWESISLPIDSSYSADTGIKISILDCDLKGYHKQIGSIETTLNELLKDSSSSYQFKLKRSRKKNGKTGKMTLTNLVNLQM